jgi:hypothetical protein
LGLQDADDLSIAQDEALKKDQHLTSDSEVCFCLNILAMTSKPNVKVVFKQIKFSDTVANILVNTKGIDTMAKPDRITSLGASTIWPKPSASLGEWG